MADRRRSLDATQRGAPMSMTEYEPPSTEHEPPSTEHEPPSTEHPHFDSLCAAVDDYEPLPDRAFAAPEAAAGAAGSDGVAGAAGVAGVGASIDAEILAGLVSP